MPNDANTSPDASGIPNSKLETRNYVQVSAGVIFRGGKLLITQRRPQDHLGGLWEFPGGKKHDGESDEECLKRELIEELGIEVEIKSLLEDITHEYPGKTVRLKFFHCVWLRHEPRALHCHDFAWIGRDQLDDYEFPAADARLLQSLQNTLQIWR